MRKDVTKKMINNFHLTQLGIDFMGYTFEKECDLSFHHLLVPKKLCKLRGFGDGYEEWNACILVRDTAHDYLHFVEKYDRNKFNDITYEMIKEKEKGELVLKNILKIDYILSRFEAEYDDLYYSDYKARPLKDKYLDRNIDLVEKKLRKYRK